jgi:hypothetical protein
MSTVVTDGVIESKIKSRLHTILPTVKHPKILHEHNPLSWAFYTQLPLREMVFNSASKYKSMKYSWQNRHAPFLRPSIVEA